MVKLKKKSLVVRYLYGYRYSAGNAKEDYIYFVFTKKKSIGYYGWKREDINKFFRFDVKPDQIKKVHITIKQIN